MASERLRQIKNDFPVLSVQPGGKLRDQVVSPGNKELVMNDLGHYLFQKTDCAIRRKVGHRIIVSCFGQPNMIYEFFINIQDQKIQLMSSRLDNYL